MELSQKEDYDLQSEILTFHFFADFAVECKKKNRFSSFFENTQNNCSADFVFLSFHFCCVAGKIVP